VDKGFLSPHRVQPGANVHVLFYQESQPHVLTAQVGSLAPVALTTKDAEAHLLQPSMRSILVSEEEGQVAKAECRVRECSVKDNEWHVEVDVTEWEELDRRRYPRIEVEVPVKLRLVKEATGGASITEILGITKDLSLGGTRLTVAEPIAAGSLVEMQAALRPKEHIRVLAVVVRGSDEATDIGLEFLDYVGGARYAMHTFLSEEAA
jgi:hypothetical protein